MKAPKYDCWWSLPGLPKFNMNNPQVRKYIFNIARYWLEEGIDGWRLDVPLKSMMTISGGDSRCG